MARRRGRRRRHGGGHRRARRIERGEAPGRSRRMGPGSRRVLLGRRAAPPAPPTPAGTVSVSDGGVTAEQRVAVLVATFRRPALLRQLLQSLPEGVAGLPEGWSADITIVDNDPAGGASATVAAMSPSAPVP